MSLVTICITTYNRKELLPFTLKSVINQTYQDTEILIIDDYSNDGTQELITKELLKIDSRIKYIRHENNKGLAAARNTAIFHASGKYFTFIDDDDQWKPNFVEEFVQLAENYNDGWCFCLLPEINRSRINKTEGKLADFIVDGVTPPVASQFYFSSTLKRIGGYDERIKSGVDHDLWFTLSVEDINIRFLDKDLAITNKNFNESRMTTNFHNRINRINNSLKIWRGKIENYYGKEFYLHFHSAYNYYLTKKAVLNDLRNKRLISAVKKIKYSPRKLLLLNELSKMLLRKLFHLDRISIDNSFLPFKG